MNAPINPQSDAEILVLYREYFRTTNPDIKVAAMLYAETKRTALKNCQSTLATAIGHLQAVLNQSRTHAAQHEADTAARDWLESIGSEPDDAVTTK